MRILLLPISFLYHLVLCIRHKLYDWHILRSTRFDAPVICVGNLSLGGTGKTPHTEYLIRMLSPDYRVAILSRGYGRQTTGFVRADTSCSAADIGDEPMQYFSKFNDLQIAVDEDRAKGVRMLMALRTPPQVILLDDAFQHRKIVAGLNLLLTEYDHPYCDDFLIPAGTLRDIRQAARRADIIVVSKCPADISEEERAAITRRLKPTKRQKVYFSYLEYEPLRPLNDRAKAFDMSRITSALVFSGIAHPKPLTDELELRYGYVETITFADHHDYDEADIRRIKDAYKALDDANQNKIIVTTEKDAARLAKSAYLCQFESVPLFAAPVHVCFLEEDKFNEDIKNYVRQDTRDCCVSAPAD